MAIEWLVEFRGETRRVDTIEAPQFHAIVSDTRRMLEDTLGAAEDELVGLKIVYFVDEGETGGWGFRFVGPPFAVNLAKDLVGERRSTFKPSH